MIRRCRKMLSGQNNMVLVFIIVDFSAKIWYNYNDDIRIVHKEGTEMNTQILSFEDIVKIVKPLAEKYHIKEVYIFGSYARGEANGESDVDVLAVGGEGFKLTNILAFGYELSVAFGRDVDAFELRELKKDTDFYSSVMRDRVRVA